MQVLNIQPLTPEWHEKRRVSITGTDVAALLLGKHFQKTPLSIWARITGKVPPKEISGKHLSWGRRSEKLNRDWLEDETGRLILPGPGLIAHDDYPWFVGTPDGFVLRPEDKGDWEGGVWEAKAPTVWTPDDWKQAVPKAYQIQTQTYMQLSGRSWGTASAVLVEPGAFCPDLYWKDLQRDDRFQDLMMQAVTRFWELNILRDVRPEPGDSAADGKLLDQLIDPEAALSVELPGDVVDLTWQYDAVAAEIKMLENKKTAIKNRVKDELLSRDAAAGEDHEGNKLWTWKTRRGSHVQAHVRPDTRPLNRSKYQPE